MESEPIIRAGQLIGDAKSPAGGAPYAVIPSDSKLEPLEGLLPTPIRHRATVTANDVPTVIAYFNRFKSGASALFADQPKFTIVGILDYHAPETPAFREHRLSYAAPRSLEWLTWRAQSGKRMDQETFAQFIEDNVVDIREPAGADVLEVARNLQSKKKVEFSSAIRLADGQQQFSYQEAIDGSTAKGQIKIPDTFKLGIPVFLGGDMYEVTARLRYRIESGKLGLWYELYRPEHIEIDAFSQVVTKVADGTATPVWAGVP